MMARIARSLIVAGLLVGAAAVIYWRWSADHQQKAMDELRTLLAKQDELLTQRQAMLDRLSRSRRIAHLQVLDQVTESSGEVASTTFEFIELDEEGGELDRQTFTVPGDVLYIDAWTVKFDPERVAEGDPLRGRTLILLRRVYSERLAPAEGIAIDTPGAAPAGYAGSDMARFEQHLWEHFWRIATDLKLAAELGVRVAQGEAVYKPVKAGQAFELIVDAAGGMNLTPIDSAEAERRRSRPLVTRFDD